MCLGYLKIVKSPPDKMGKQQYPSWQAKILSLTKIKPQGPPLSPPFDLFSNPAIGKLEHTLTASNTSR
jgi:hypothetical protein